MNRYRASLAVIGGSGRDTTAFSGSRLMSSKFRSGTCIFALLVFVVFCFCVHVRLSHDESACRSHLAKHLAEVILVVGDHRHGDLKMPNGTPYRRPCTSRYDAPVIG